MRGVPVFPWLIVWGLAAWLPEEAFAEKPAVGLNGAVKVVAAASGSSSVQAADAGHKPGRLRWTNGEMLHGNLGDADAGGLAWATPFFVEPLHLDWKALRRVDLPVVATAQGVSGDGWSFALRDGSFVYGNPGEVSEGEVVVESSRHGTLRLRRSHVLWMRRNGSADAGSQVVFNGPQGAAGWRVEKSPERDWAVRPVEGGACGVLVFPYWNTEAVMSLELPAEGEMECVLRGKGRPDFALTVQGIGGVVRVETWGEELVLASGTGFVTLRTLGEGDEKVALRMRWDSQKRRCSVYAEEGALLGEIDVLEAAPAQAGQSGRQRGALIKRRGEVAVVDGDGGVVVSSGASGASEATGDAGARKIRLLNKGKGLVLERLRVEAVRGDALQTKAAGAGPSAVVLRDGRSLRGERIALSGGMMRVVSGNGAEDPLSLSEVESVVFVTDVPQVDAAADVVSYGDGTLLFGEILGLGAGRAVMHTRFAGEPVAVTGAGLQQWRRPPGAPVEADAAVKGMDKVEMEGGLALHGSMVDAGGGQPGWLPVGGLRASALTLDRVWEVIRGFPASARHAAPKAQLHAVNGDVLPVVLGAVGAEEVGFESSLFSARVLGAGQLSAVDFQPKSFEKLAGFADGWEVVKGDGERAVRTLERLVLKPGAVVWHPTAAESRELRFQVDSPANGGNGAQLLIGLCADRAGKSAAKLQFVRYGDFAYLNGMGGAAAQRNSQSRQMTAGEPAVIRIVNESGHVVVWLNGMQMMEFELGNNTAAAGLRLEYGEGGVRAGAAELSVSGFSAEAGFGTAPLPAVDVAEKAQALTVPRFRKDLPPLHALIAQNGDLLPGAIEAVSAKQLRFRAGLQHFDVPRERVRMAVWLRGPGSAEAAPGLPPEIEAKLAKEIPQHFSIHGNAESIASTVGAQGGMEVRLPRGLGQTVKLVQFQGCTVREALDLVAQTFSLSYEVDEKGVVVFEKSAGDAGVLREATFWLKEKAFASGASVAGVLKGAGVAIGGSKRVAWEPEFRQLTVVHTAEGIGRVRALLAEKLGGIEDEASHHLVLVDGSRFYLKVEEFSKEAITGRHPVYGRCTVPMAQVCRISSATVVRAMGDVLRGWTLVNAPEPKIPEGK